MYMVSKTFEWCMAHRLVKGYKGKCKNIHGHRYLATVVMQGDRLNAFDMLKDYNDMKVFKEWIDLNLDHSCMVSVNDRSLLKFLRKEGNRCFVFSESNPTAENIAERLYCVASGMLNDDYATVIEVKVKESDGTEAIYREN